MYLRNERDAVLIGLADLLCIALHGFRSTNHEVNALVDDRRHLWRRFSVGETQGREGVRGHSESVICAEY